MYDLTGIYWIKDEAPYLPEYLEFHLMQGFDHFVFYDNRSTDETADVLVPYIRAGIAELRHYPPHVTQRNNFWLMQHCIIEQVGCSRWIHFHAVDERVYCPDGRRIPDLLKEYEDFGGLAVAWRNMNSSGHKTKPRGLVIENYTQAVKDPKYHIKTIIQPHLTETIFPANGYVTYPADPHHFRHRETFSVNENRVRVEGPFCPQDYSMKLIKNHHYQTMSEEEFNAKMNKGLLDHAGQESIRRNDAEQQWALAHDPANFDGEEKSLLPWVPKVREAIEKRFENYGHLLGVINH